MFCLHGLLFILSSWTCVFICHLNKEKLNQLTIPILLVLISGSYLTFNIDAINVNISFIILFVLISYFLSLLNKSVQIILFIKGLIIGMVYSSMSIIVIYDPASFFINIFLSTSLLAIVLALFLSKNFEEQIKLILIGLIQGEIFNFFTFRSIKVDYVIGDINWLAILFATILLLILVKSLSLRFAKRFVKGRKLINN